MILNRRSYILATVLSVLALSCTKKGIPAEEGFFGISLSADSGTISLTKAETVLSDEDAADFNLSLSHDGVALWSHTFAQFLSGNYSKVTAGDYTITAEDITGEQAEEGRGRIRLEGAADFTVRGGRTTEVQLCCKCANAKASVGFDESFKGNFESGAVVTFSDGKRVLEMPEGHSDANAAYFNCTEDGVAVVYYQVTATPVGGTAKEYSGSFTFPKGKWSKVTFSSGSVGVITVSIFADKSLSDVREDESFDPMI